MRYYTRNGKKFFAPDGGGGGGGGASPASPTSITPPAGGGTDDPFAKIDMDSLDDVSRAVVEGLKGQFATLQKTATDATREARLHQSEKDKALAQLNQVRSAATGQPTQHGQPHQRPPTTEERVLGQLRANGMKDEDAIPQAKVLASILESERAVIQQQLQRDMGSVAGLALQQNAESAFNAARMSDRVGWTQIPEVATLVWNACCEMAQAGTPLDAATVKNLAAMHFMAYAETNPAVFATLQNQPNQPNNGQHQPVIAPTTTTHPPMPMFTGGYFGSTFNGTRNPAPANPNGARTIPDASTAHAIQMVNKQWEQMGMKPKGGN